VNDLANKREGVTDLLDTINDHVPSPDVKIDDDFRMLIT
jgi:predicted membrane GTPase involved in stress response